MLCEEAAICKITPISYYSLSGGELFDRIVDDGYTMNEAEAIKYIRQLLLGLQHMHEHHIVHLDIKVSHMSRIHNLGMWSSGDCV